MSAKRRAAVAPPPPPPFRFWLPSLVLLGAAAYMLVSSLAVRNYGLGAHLTHDRVLTGISILCWALAASLALLPPLRRSAVEHLDRLAEATPRVRLAWLGAAFLGFFLWFGFIRWCQYRICLLSLDSVNSVMSAYSFIHHGVMEFPAWGVKSLSIHFMLLMGAFSPILLVWNSPVALLTLQALFLCSAPFAAYALVRQRGGAVSAAFAAMLLTLSTPYLSELMFSDLQNSSAAVFLPWGAYFLHRRNWALVGVLAALLVCSQEQMPFLFFGVGLYAIYALRERSPWNWVVGLGICAAATALWIGENAVLRHYQELEAANSPIDRARYWNNFAHLAPAGTPPESLASEIVTHPLRTLKAVFSTAYRFYPVTRVLFFAGFLPLLAPWELIVFVVTAVPQVIANPGEPMVFLSPLGTHGKYHALGFHYSTYVFGPMVWALAHGVLRAHSWLSRRGGQGWLLVWALATAGLGWRCAQRPLQLWRPPWFDSYPRLAAMIPPKARVWTEEFGAMPLSNRRWLKAIQWGPTPSGGFQKLFAPDYVLLDKSFVALARPPFRESLLTFLAQGKYEKVGDDLTLALLKAPQTAADPEAEPEWIKLPDPDPAAAEAYGRYLLKDTDDAAIARSYGEAVAVAPHEPSGRTLYGFYLEKSGRFEDAASQYREALRLDPGYAPARIQLAELLAQKGVGATSTEASAALRVDPSNAKTWLQLGEALAREGKQNEAVSAFERATQLEPSSPQPLYGLGLALIARQDWPGAERRFREVLRLAPGHGPSSNNLAYALVRQGRKDEAIVVLRRALEIDPNFMDAKKNLIILLQEKNRPR